MTHTFVNEYTAVFLRELTPFGWSRQDEEERPSYELSPSTLQEEFPELSGRVRANELLGVIRLDPSTLTKYGQLDTTGYGFERWQNDPYSFKTKTVPSVWKTIFFIIAKWPSFPVPTTKHKLHKHNSEKTNLNMNKIIGERWLRSSEFWMEILHIIYASKQWKDVIPSATSWAVRRRRCEFHRRRWRAPF